MKKHRYTPINELSVDDNQKLIKFQNSLDELVKSGDLEQVDVDKMKNFILYNSPDHYLGYESLISFLKGLYKDKLKNKGLYLKSDGTISKDKWQGILLESRSSRIQNFTEFRKSF